MTYDFFVAGRTRNKDAITVVVDALRAKGKKVYCFLENTYESVDDGVAFKDGVDPEESMKAFESIKDWRNNSLVKEIFQKDMDALKESAAAVVVLPAGKSAHIEAGAAYGLGKPVYAVGDVPETESLYLIFNEIYPDANSLAEGVTNG